jgi:hypothetical protein
MQIVMLHAARQLPAWLIFDVSQKKMKRIASPEFPRRLSPRETEVAQWLIANGEASEEEKHVYLDQLERAMVVRRCPCGCASIDFAIDGHESAETGIVPFGDFVTPESRHGIFVFSRADLLAGIEIYMLAADSLPEELPPPIGFTPFHAAKNG